METEVKLLVVEDKRPDALMVQGALRGAPGNYHCVTVERLAEALALLATPSFDVVLLDLDLPDSQGLLTLEKTLASSSVPVVVLTALDDELTAIRAVQAGAQDYLIKGQCDGALIARALRYAMERKRLQEELQQARRLEAVGRLAGGVAHDFNNLMTVVTGYGDLLAQEAPPDTNVGRWAKSICEAADRAARLTSQLLAVGRRHTLLPSVFDLNPAILDLRDMLKCTARSDIALELELGPEPQRIRADRGQLEQVVVNLVANACDAMPHGGRLILRTATRRLDSRTLCGEQPVESGLYVVFTVADTGYGMDARTRERIFEPFFTTKGPRQGAGLGLATVYGIVKQSGGHISVRSEIGKGSEFTVALPHADGSLGSGSPSLSEEGQMAHRQAALVAQGECRPASRT
ncbi:MAG TPA: ATP-binding protein [Terriglobales bacterium]|nr:ATP-binding protein [Terriglobales bacterium]